MGARHFILVVYDISDDKRRTRLHNMLLDFGTPVQYSVFECLLTAENERKMHQKMDKIIRPKVDRVRFYVLCADCVKNVQVTSGKEVLHDDLAAIVIG